MDNNQIKEYIIDFQKTELPELIERSLKIKDTKKIVSVIGPRRAGKTYFMYQKIKGLIKSKISKETILYLNFEDPRLIDISYKDFMEIVKIHWQLYPNTINKKLLIFIDEPQNINKWEIGVRSLYDDGFKIFITGSSSKLLSKEIATNLRGRSLSYILLPFSFEEYLKIKGVSFDISKLGSKDKSLLFSLLREYINYGGFPEVIQEKHKENRLKIIKEYFDMIVYKDIVERYKIKNTFIVKWLIKSVISSLSREFSINKIYLTLKSKGLKVSKNTLYSYLSMLEDSVFVFSLEPFSNSVRKKDFSVNKVYICDVGFSRLIESSRNIGNKIENIVFLELKKKESALTSLYYYKNPQDYEVDFVVKEGLKVRQLIQVCYNIEDIDTKKREIRALLHASRNLKCKNLLVITEDYENEENIEWFGIKRKIKFIPLWKWLLEK